MNPSSQPENREQTFESKLDEILQKLSLTQQFLGEQFTSSRINDLRFQSKDDDARAEAKQAIKTLYKQERLQHLSTKIKLDEQNKKVEAFENMLNAFGLNPQKEEL